MHHPWIMSWMAKVGVEYQQLADGHDDAPKAGDPAEADAAAEAFDGAADGHCQLPVCDSLICRPPAGWSSNPFIAPPPPPVTESVAAADSPPRGSSAADGIAPAGERPLDQRAEATTPCLAINMTDNDPGSNHGSNPGSNPGSNTGANPSGSNATVPGRINVSDNGGALRDSAPVICSGGTPRRHVPAALSSLPFSPSPFNKQRGAASLDGALSSGLPGSLSSAAEGGLIHRPRPPDPPAPIRRPASIQLPTSSSASFQLQASSSASFQLPASSSASFQLPALNGASYGLQRNLLSGGGASNVNQMRSTAKVNKSLHVFHPHLYIQGHSLLWIFMFQSVSVCLSVCLSYARLSALLRFSLRSPMLKLPPSHQSPFLPYSR